MIGEVANETMAGYYHHEVLKPGRTAELIVRARTRAADVYGRALLVTISEAALLNPRQWTPAQIDAVLQACDVIVIHGGDSVETGRGGMRVTWSPRSSWSVHGPGSSARPGRS